MFDCCCFSPLPSISVEAPGSPAASLFSLESNWFSCNLFLLEPSAIGGIWTRASTTGSLLLFQRLSSESSPFSSERPPTASAKKSDSEGRGVGWEEPWTPRGLFPSSFSPSKVKSLLLWHSQAAKLASSSVLYCFSWHLLRDSRGLWFSRKTGRFAAFKGTRWISRFSCCSPFLVQFTFAGKSWGLPVSVLFLPLEPSSSRDTTRSTSPKARPFNLPLLSPTLPPHFSECPKHHWKVVFSKLSFGCGVLQESWQLVFVSQYIAAGTSSYLQFIPPTLIAALIATPVNIVWLPPLDWGLPAWSSNFLSLPTPCSRRLAASADDSAGLEVPSRNLERLPSTQFGSSTLLFHLRN